MSLRADVHLDSPALVMGETTRAVPDLSFEVEHQSSISMFLVSVDAAPLDGQEGFAALEDALRSDPTIESFRVAIDNGIRRIYALELDIDRPILSEVAAELGINVLSAWSRPGEGGWTFELEVPDRQALVDLRQFWEKEDVPFDLRRLFTQEPTSPETSYGLSEVQRETLLTAYESGYFEVPRGISQRELAEVLGASPTAVSQRVRRAITTLIDNTLGREE